MEIFWINKLPSSPVSLVIPGAPTLYDRIYGKEREDKERILRCLMNIKSEIDVHTESVDVQNLRPVELSPMSSICSIASADYSNSQTAEKQDISEENRDSNPNLLGKLRSIARRS